MDLELEHFQVTVVLTRKMVRVPGKMSFKEKVSMKVSEKKVDKRLKEFRQTLWITFIDQQGIVTTKEVIRTAVTRQK